jgi:hypothetical protein
MHCATFSRLFPFQASTIGNEPLWKGADGRGAQVGNAIGIVGWVQDFIVNRVSRHTLHSFFEWLRYRY